MDSISVIVPSYNEEKTVKLFYDEMKRIMKKMNEIDFEIIFVDDGSKDNTVFCKHFLEKNAKYFWRMLHLQIGESCKASAGSYSASYIAIADHI